MASGVISDTHGVLRVQAVDALRGSELILHAGDIGTADVLQELKRIAPVVAVRGNGRLAPENIWQDGSLKRNYARAGCGLGAGIVCDSAP